MNIINPSVGLVLVLVVHACASLEVFALLRRLCSDTWFNVRTASLSLVIATMLSVAICGLTFAFAMLSDRAWGCRWTWEVLTAVYVVLGSLLFPLAVRAVLQPEENLALTRRRRFTPLPM